MAAALTASHSFGHSSCSWEGSSEEGRLTSGHPCDFIVLTSLGSTKTSVKGLDKSLKFFTYNFPGSFYIVCLLFSRSVVSDALQLFLLLPARLLCPWDFPGKNTRMGCHFFPDPGIEPLSPALQVGSLPLGHQGSLVWLLGRGYFSGCIAHASLPQLHLPSPVHPSPYHDRCHSLIEWLIDWSCPFTVEPGAPGAAELEPVQLWA